MGGFSIKGWEPPAAKKGVIIPAEYIPEGLKYDQGKLRLDLLPLDSLMKVASVYTYGAKKYADENWRLGISWKRIFGAVMRHTWAWMLGEDVDPESSLPHLAHASFGLLTLLNYAETHPEFDDRAYTPKKGKNV